MSLKSLTSWVRDCSIANQIGTSMYISKLKEAVAIANKLQAENKRLKIFFDEWDGHSSSCGSNREGFEGCDETMFNCDCGYEDAKKQALKGKQ